VNKLLATVQAVFITLIFSAFGEGEVRAQSDDDISAQAIALVNSQANTLTPPSPVSPCTSEPDPISRSFAAYLQPKPFTKDALSGETSDCPSTSADTDANFSYCINEGENHGFTLANRGSLRINPVGGNVRREFSLSSPQDARQDTGLLVYEWGTPDAGGDDSAWSMMTEIVFFPRKVMPAIRELNAPDGTPAYEVTIPTGETILYDRKTKEIIGGVLKETTPIDMRQDRHTREFAGLLYEGKGIMVRSDQRGDTPRSAVVWGQRKLATVTWGNKTCKVSPADIWQQQDPSNNLYSKDEDFYSMLYRKCGWNVSSADFGL
jgi:hypothetical protein